MQRVSYYANLSYTIIHFCDLKWTEKISFTAETTHKYMFTLINMKTSWRKFKSTCKLSKLNWSWLVCQTIIHLALTHSWITRFYILNCLMTATRPENWNRRIYTVLSVQLNATSPQYKYYSIQTVLKYS